MRKLKIFHQILQHTVSGHSQGRQLLNSRSKYSSEDTLYALTNLNSMAESASELYRPSDRRLSAK
jgi:hypothetical protein